MATMFGEYIRKYRAQKSLTLTQLAAQIDMDSGNLSKIENGRRFLDEKKLSKLASALELPQEEVKDEYYSDLIAHKVFEAQCSEKILEMAEQKIRLIKQMKLTQGNLDFKV